jgi:ribonuclease HII
MAEYPEGLLAGIDEAGRGPLAGPVVAAAVIFDPKKPVPAGLNDSKRMTHAAREKLYAAITRKALSFGIGSATAQEIDLYNVLEATRLAARRAYTALAMAPSVLATDCLELPWSPIPVYPIIKGDAICASIAAASILAKVTRDRLMLLYHAQFPQYRWDENKGYPSPSHYAALGEHGPCSLHRLSFSGVDFFSSELQWSPDGTALRQAIDSGCESPLALAARVASLAHRLPPLEVQALRDQLAAIPLSE